MMKKTIRDIDVSGKRVFVRVDYNVPMNAELKIVDDTRITATLPTINYLIEHNAKVILCSHLGDQMVKWILSCLFVQFWLDYRNF